jgi:excisionase family DNA binding protein
MSTSHSPAVEHLLAEYYPNPQAAWQDLGITRSEFSNLVRRGLLRIVRFGGARLIRRDEVAELRATGPALNIEQPRTEPRRPEQKSAGPRQ